MALSFAQSREKEFTRLLQNVTRIGLVRRSSPPSHELIEMVRDRGEDMGIPHSRMQGHAALAYNYQLSRGREQTAQRLVDVFGPEVRALADNAQARINESTAAWGFLL